MSFKAVLALEGKSYQVRSSYTTIRREIDKKGRPSSMPVWYTIITVDATDDTTITNWMIDPTKEIEGQLIIYEIDEDAKLKEIKFKKSYCTHMVEKFMADISFTCCEIMISGGELEIDAASLVLR